MSVTPIPPRPLTPQEADTLAAQEGVIARGLQTFYDVGSALATIRDERLYRADFGTFEDYCQERWGMTRQHANRLVASAATMRNLEPTGSIFPTTERQARPLAQRSPEEQPRVWARAVELAGNAQPTAAQVTQAAEYFRPAPSPFRAAVAQAVERDGSYRENVLMEQYHAVAQRLLAAASTGRDLVRHVAPDEIAAFLTEEDDKTFTYVADLLGWLQRAHEARRARAQGIRRIK